MCWVAAVSHCIGTVASFIAGKSSLGGVWDAGHALLPAVLGARWAADAVTLAVPVVVIKTTPRRERWHTVAGAMTSYGLLTILRSLTIMATVLPPLTPPEPVSLLNVLYGHGHDFIFSGHTAFIACWLLRAVNVTPPLAWAAAAAHATLLLVARMHYSVDILVAWMLAYLIDRLRPTDPPILHFVQNRTDVYRARHEVYAQELGQYPENASRTLTDPTDARNQYIVVTKGGALQGFVAVTPPGGALAMHRHGLFPPAGEDAHEIRLLTVLPGCRGRGLARALIHAALRYVDASGGGRGVAMARAEVLPLYLEAGMRVVSDEPVWCGSVQYFLIEGTIGECRDDQGAWAWQQPGVVWDLPFAPNGRGACTHGGTALELVRPNDQHVSADVLDAWYPPAPGVLASVRFQLEKLMMTTPPAKSQELVDAIARSRGVSPASIMVGAGSSDLIYRCFLTWLTPASTVLVCDPTYAEYAHVLSVIGCTVRRVQLDPEDDYELRVDMLPANLDDIDLAIIVNPNSPTGRHCGGVLDIVRLFSERTKVWVDETYIDFVGREHSVERSAERTPNVVVCKSMSKVYALSGTRLAYACAHPALLDAVRARTPPWLVSRIAQAAGLAALEDPEYYARRVEETHVLRQRVREALEALGVRVVPGCANFLMCFPPPGTTAADVLGACRAQGVYLRDVLRDNAFRVAIKDGATNDRIVRALAEALKSK